MSAYTVAALLRDLPVYDSSSFTRLQTDPSVPVNVHPKPYVPQRELEPARSVVASESPTLLVRLLKQKMASSPMDPAFGYEASPVRTVPAKRGRSHVQ